MMMKRNSLRKIMKMKKAIKVRRIKEKGKWKILVIKILMRNKRVKIVYTSQRKEIRRERLISID